MDRDEFKLAVAALGVMLATAFYAGWWARDCVWLIRSFMEAR